MTRKAKRRDPFPKPALYGAATVLGLTLVLVTAARLTGYKEDVDPGGTPVTHRDVVFETDNDGVIEIADQKSGQTLGRLPSATNRFVRVVISSLAYERAGLEPGNPAPYRIVRWDDGRISVADPVSGRSIELAAFGRHQVETFENLLD